VQLMAGISGVELLTMMRTQGYRVPLISRPSLMRASAAECAEGRSNFLPGRARPAFRSGAGPKTISVLMA
jgi:hypothetical protein